MATISRRARELGTENAFVVLAEVGKLEAAGKSIVSFCIGQPDFPTPEHIQMAGIKAITDGHHGYTPSPGIPALREAVAAYFSRTRGVAVEPDDKAPVHGHTVRLNALDRIPIVLPVAILPVAA